MNIKVPTLFRRSMLAFTERYYEHQLGIRTRKKIELNSVGIYDPEAVVCTSIPYTAFFKAMRFVGAEIESSMFVDYGCGLGRAVCCAALRPFKRVIGIELAPQIAASARDNVESMRPRFRCRDVQILTENATQWAVPSDTTVFHFHNPFIGKTLRTVLAEIARSLREKPRLAWIMSAEPWLLRGHMRAGKIIPHLWQAEEYSVKFPFFEDVSLRDPEGHRYRVFVLDSRTDRIGFED